VYFQYTELAEVSIPKSTPPTELAEVPTPNSLHRACRGAISPFFSKKSQPFLPNNPLNITIFHSFQPGKNPHSSRGIPLNINFIKLSKTTQNLYQLSFSPLLSF
jgi:hypothetical protein